MLRESSGCLAKKLTQSRAQGTVMHELPSPVQHSGILTPSEFQPGYGSPRTVAAERGQDPATCPWDLQV